nr:protein dopey-1-like isoform X5 [Biomphalaria glabrata]
MDEDCDGWRPNPLFTPHIIRLSRLLNNRMKKKPTLMKTEPGRPLLTMPKLQSLADLQSFFYTVCHSTEGTHHSSMGAKHSKPPTTSADRQHLIKVTSSKDDMSALSNRAYLEHLLEVDFLEPLS